MKLLHIDSSILGDNSASRALTAEIVQRLTMQNPGLQLTRLDLDAEPLPHLSAGSLAKVDATETARSERALHDFLEADVLVIGAPMYNFSIPSTLKAWIDRIAIAGKSFRYTATGPEGLAKGKVAILAITQGGVHELGGPSEHHESYLRFVLNFLGVSDVRVVRAQGLARSELRESALNDALGAVPASLALAA
ncbi:MAG: NAD(P)H-dependent oxidoreductase [Lysobacterales bacterium]|nr:NAD(P)H-dependent oxidoreductase [Xanthomonadales bacterium]MCP5476422.1 NAD(P)H-dependent oxidoreductase [Rhodanobacteraceae bacterium]